jgi:hypothetical protein
MLQKDLITSEEQRLQVSKCAANFFNREDKMYVMLFADTL